MFLYLAMQKEHQKIYVCLSVSFWRVQNQCTLLLKTIALNILEYLSTFRHTHFTNLNFSEIWMCHKLCVILISPCQVGGGVFLLLKLSTQWTQGCSSCQLGDHQPCKEIPSFNFSHNPQLPLKRSWIKACRMGFSGLEEKTGNNHGIFAWETAVSLPSLENDIMWNYTDTHNNLKVIQRC